MADASLPRLPTLIPAPLVDPYRTKPRLQQVRTDFPNGPSRVRNLVRRVDYEITLGWRFTRAEFALWTWFYQTATRFGTAWFVMPLAGPLGLFDAECQVLEAPEDAPIGCMAAWNTPAKLLVRNYPLISENDAYAQFPGLKADLSGFDADMNQTIPGKTANG